MRELGPRPALHHPDPCHWRSIQSAALARDQGCRLCGADADLEVHHRTYARWGQEQLDDVTVLCRGCHDLFTGAQMRRRDERRRPPPPGRAIVTCERFQPRPAPALPEPVRTRHIVEHPARSIPATLPVPVPARARR